MLDIRFIRENTDAVRASLANRNSKVDLDSLIKIDDSRRQILSELEGLRAQRNKANDQISVLLKEKKDAKDMIASMKEVSAKIGGFEAELKILDVEGLSKMYITYDNVVEYIYSDVKLPKIPIEPQNELILKEDWITFFKTTRKFNINEPYPGAWQLIQNY